MCQACHMRCCAGWEDEGCGCLEGCDEPKCSRQVDDDDDLFGPESVVVIFEDDDPRD
jgi:hypothetical protein